MTTWVGYCSCMLGEAVLQLGASVYMCPSSWIESGCQSTWEVPVELSLFLFSYILGAMGGLQCMCYHCQRQVLCSVLQCTWRHQGPTMVSRLSFLPALAQHSNWLWQFSSHCTPKLSLSWISLQVKTCGDSLNSLDIYVSTNPLA